MNQPIIGTSPAHNVSTKTRILHEKNPLATLDNNNENLPPAPANGGESLEELKQQFSQFKFYLDNIDDQQQKKIRDRLKIFLATAEPFFSKKCTHVITTKPIPGKGMPLGENKQPVDNIISNALKWNLKVWSLDHMNKVMQSMVNGHSSGHRAIRSKAIGKILEDEKKFGVGTNHGGSPNTRNATKQARPIFVPFRKYYLSVEDARGVYRPVAVKEYEPGRTYPFPKITPGGKSPFTTVPNQPVLAPLTRPTLKASSQPLPSQKGQDIKEMVDKENNHPSSQTLPNKSNRSFAKPLGPQTKAPATIPHPISTPPMSPIDPSIQQKHPTSHDNNNNNVNNNTQNSSSQLKASGLCPSQSTNVLSRTRTFNSRIISTTSESTTKVYMDNAQAQDELVARLDRRMVDNNRINGGENAVPPNTGNSKQLLKTATMNQKDAQAKARQEHEKKQAQKKKEQEMMHWCENCNKRYINLKEHIQEKAHQTFVQDQNNFRKFDDLVATLRRPKLPQPSFSSTHVESKDIILKDVVRDDMDIDQ